MTIKSKDITTGVIIWINTADPKAIWLELGKKKAAAFVAADTLGILFLGLLPPPYSVIAVSVAKANHSVIKNNLGPNGVWIKIGAINPFMEARARTSSNKGKTPSPW